MPGTGGRWTGGLRAALLRGTLFGVLCGAGVMTGCETTGVEPLTHDRDPALRAAGGLTPEQRAAAAERERQLSQSQSQRETQQQPGQERAERERAEREGAERRREARGERPTPVRTAPRDSEADRRDREREARAEAEREASVEIDPARAEEPPQAIGSVRAMRVRANLLPRGSVPYDNLSLPLVSPCGTYIATQTGIPPTWHTLIASPDAEPPFGTDIDIFELDLESRTAEYVATVETDALLGRSVNDRGFLIESPRDDGSRWLGFVDWVDGEITWLIQDDAVNAFAVLGADGRIAWSRRSAYSEIFELVIWDGRQELVLSDDDNLDWVMPTWAPTGNGLFVITVSESGRMNFVYGVGSDAASFRQTRQQLNLVREGNIFGAYQAMNGQVTSPDLFASTRDHISFFHPGAGRACVWRPLERRGEELIVLMRGSIFALLESADHAAVTTESGLYRQNLNDPDDRAEMVRGTLLPRLTYGELWPYLLLAPGDDTIGLTSMRLLPRD